MSGKAESRLIYNTISTSERIASLGVKGALLFTWLITHCDSQGRMQGKPTIVKQQVVPFIEEITVEDVESCLKLMNDAKLIKLYKDDKGRLLIQVVDWWEWQKLRYLSASHYQAPKGWMDKLTQRDEGGRFTKDDI
jgi:hypothetical protein